MKGKAAFVWDFDGVIALTPHEEAWRMACMKYGIEGFDSDFYSGFVSGRSRLEGARNILERLAPWLLQERGGRIVEEFADFKTEIYLRLVEKGNYKVNKNVVWFIRAAREEKILQILASASKNVLLIAEREKVDNRKLIELFDADVSGKESTKLGVFLLAKEEALKLARGDLSCLVFFDDAPAGVKAAKEVGGKAVGCFDPKLSAVGADLVVEDFSALSPRDLLSRLGCVP